MSAAQRATGSGLGDGVAHPGRCAVCGAAGSLRFNAEPSRDGLPCRNCSSTLRWRQQAAVLVSLYSRHGARSLSELVGEPSFRALGIYHPGGGGPLRPLLSELPDYVQSRYWPDLVSGDHRDGYRCENLEALTFGDGEFDLVITSDLLEHVRRTWHAFAEILRVLAPGGRHVFTVPSHSHLPTRPRIDVGTEGDPDVALIARRYHGADPHTNGALLYTDFGPDLPARLAPLGCETHMYEAHRCAYTFVSRRASG